jgi:hypothetical protein
MLDDCRVRIRLSRINRERVHWQHNRGPRKRVDLTQATETLRHLPLTGVICVRTLAGKWGGRAVRVPLVVNVFEATLDTLTSCVGGQVVYVEKSFIVDSNSTQRDSLG